MILERVSVGPMQVNCYILAGGKNQEAIIIDPGADPGSINEVLKAHSLRPGIIINTHGHADHIGADHEFDVPIYIHEDDSAFLDDPRKNLSVMFGDGYKVGSDKINKLKDGDTVKLGDISATL